MSLHKCKLGELITQRREKNNDDSLPISGVSKDGLIPPKQQEADTSLYNMFYRGDFIFNPARMELNSIAYNDKYDKAICSSLYEVFYVHRTDLILPEFLALIVKQDWFTRYCEFLGQGSAREYCRFANISEIEIEYPDIDVQKKTVHCYNVIKRRIELKQQINDNLEALLLCKYHLLFDNDEEKTNCTIGDFGEIISGATPSTSINEYFCDEGIAWLTPKDLTATGKKFIYKGETDISQDAYDSCSTKLLPIGTVLLTSRAPVGTVGLAMREVCTNQGFKSIVPNTDIGSAFIYCFLKDNKSLLDSHASGTTFMEISGNVLKAVPAFIPSKKRLDEFNSYSHTIFQLQNNNEIEIDMLSSLQQTIISGISSS